MIYPGAFGGARALLVLVVAANLLAPAIAGADAASSPERGAPGGPEVGRVDGPRRSPTLTAIRTDKPPDMDGRLDDPSWQAASPETSFTQSFPDEAKPPTERTEFRVLYDDNAIYVAIRCFDSHPEEIVGRLTRRDRDIDGDKVTVEISSKNDKVSAYHFQVNPAGVQVDGIRFNDTDLGTDWEIRGPPHRGCHRDTTRVHVRCSDASKPGRGRSRRSRAEGDRARRHPRRVARRPWHARPRRATLGPS